MSAVKHPVIRVLIVMAVCAALFSSASARQYQTIERLNVATPNLQAGQGQFPVSNSNGDIVAFWSDSNLLVGGDTNNAGDIFVRNRVNDTTTRVNVGPTSTQANSITYAEIDIDNGGNLIVFASDANNLVTGDTNNLTDVFVHDRAVGVTARVSLANGGVQSNGASNRPVISGNGLLVAFRSSASNLVTGDTNGIADLFIYDRTVNQIARFNLGGGGTQANADYPQTTIALSFDGRYAAFDSLASNLVSGDTNNVSDVFVVDRATGVMRRVSTDALGVQGNGASYYPAISDDGRFVTFESTATNLVAGDSNAKTDVFLMDRDTDEDGVYDESGQTLLTRISVSTSGTQSNNNSGAPSISSGGRWISFYSLASNLVADDTNNVGDIFAYDRRTGVVSRASVTAALANGSGGTGLSNDISGDGRFVLFESAANNLVSGDTNGVSDVFIAQGGPASPTALSGTPVSQTAIDLSWRDNASDETKFVVERSLDGAAWTSIAEPAANTTTYSDTALTKCTTYFYRVVAQNSINRSPVATTINLKTLGCPPYPFDLVAPADERVVINPFSLDTFTWEPSFEAVSYTLSISDDTPVELDSITGDAAEICTADLCAMPIASETQALLVNGAYTWTVTATNSEGDTIATNAPFNFSVDNTLAPRAFNLRGPLADMVVRSAAAPFTWRANEDALSYEFYLYRLSNTPVRALGEVYSSLTLTPDSDADMLLCDDQNCTLTPDDVLQAALTEGLYSWTARAKSPGGTPTEAANAPITFSIILTDIELLTNASFELDSDADAIPDGWTLANRTKDRRRCNTETKTVAQEGSCAMEFAGSVGESAQLAQLPSYARYSLVAGDVINFSGYVRGKNFSGGGRIEVKVSYDGLTADKPRITFASGTYDYTLVNATLTVDAPPVKVRVQVQHTGTAGKLYLDNFRLTLEAQSETRGSAPQPGPDSDGWLPAPSAPTFEGAPDQFRRTQGG